MNTLVVLFVFTAGAHASYLPLAQPAHHPAVVVDARGRPLDTAEVIEARSLHLQAKALEAHGAPGVVAHSIAVPSVVAGPAAVSHQSRVDVHSSPAIVSHAVSAPVIGYAAPVVTYAATPVLSHSALGLAGHGHYLKKRSLSHLAYAVPAAVSHQSRVDVISSPAIVSHAVAAPVIAHAVATPVIARAVAAPVIAVAPAAVSHQSRVDVRTSPAVVAHAPVSAVVAAHAYGAHALSHSHLLKKRSLAAIVTPVVHTVPAAVSHQSRVDVISEPAVVAHAAPVAVVHTAPAVIAAPAAVSRQSRVDVISSAVHAAPLAHSAIWTAPVARLSHTGLIKATLW